MDKEIRYFVNGYEMLLYLSGDREERKSVDCFELQDFESEEEAVAAARDFISEHKNAVNDQKHGIGSVTYWVAVVERAVEDAVMGWLPCDRDGVTEDEEGMVPDDATVAYISTLDGSREERAFELAKHDYYGFLDYKEDRYIHIWIVSLFYYIAGLLSSWFVVLFVRDIWSIVLKIYLVWWYDILLVIKLDGRREIPWRVSHRRKKPLSVSRNSGVSRLRCAALCTRRG